MCHRWATVHPTIALCWKLSGLRVAKLENLPITHYLKNRVAIKPENRRLFNILSANKPHPAPTWLLPPMLMQMILNALPDWIMHSNLTLKLNEFPTLWTKNRPQSFLWSKENIQQHKHHRHIQAHFVTKSVKEPWIRTAQSLHPVRSGTCCCFAPRQTDCILQHCARMHLWRHQHNYRWKAPQDQQQKWSAKMGAGWSRMKLVGGDDDEVDESPKSSKRCLSNKRI